MILRVACIGRNGQTARALAAIAAADSAIELVAAGRETLDLGDADSLERFVLGARPDAVINAAAYNLVDKAESEPDVAMRINSDGPAALARICRREGLPFIHMSTDLVFDGTKPGPYVETDTPNPLSAYGRSKLAGEQAVLAEDPQALVTRVCWVYSEHGDNFVSKMLELAKTRPMLRVVSDQVGPPTHAADIAAALIAATRLRVSGPATLSGLLHLAASETVSRSDMAKAIMEESQAQGGPVAAIEPVTTADYAAPARRPLNAHLSAARADDLLCPSWRPWRPALGSVIPAILAR